MRADNSSYNLEVLNYRPGTAGTPASPPNDRVAVRRLESTLGDRSDRLVIRGGMRRSTVDLGSGDNRFRVNGRFSSGPNDQNDYAALNSNLTSGDGRDRLVFGGNVEGLNIDVDGGADRLRFRGDVTDTSLNLGSDGQRDVVRLREGADFTGFRITGADDSDVLFIGSSEYRYDDNNTWVNINNPDDRVRF